MSRNYRKCWCILFFFCIILLFTTYAFTEPVIDISTAKTARIGNSNYYLNIPDGWSHTVERPEHEFYISRDGQAIVEIMNLDYSIDNLSANEQKILMQTVIDSLLDVTNENMNGYSAELATEVYKVYGYRVIDGKKCSAAYASFYQDEKLYIVNLSMIDMTIAPKDVQSTLDSILNISHNRSIIKLDEPKKVTLYNANALKPIQFDGALFQVSVPLTWKEEVMRTNHVYRYNSPDGRSTIEIQFIDYKQIPDNEEDKIKLLKRVIHTIMISTQSNDQEVNTFAQKGILSYGNSNIDIQHTSTVGEYVSSACFGFWIDQQVGIITIANSSFNITPTIARDHLIPIINSIRISE